MRPRNIVLAILPIIFLSTVACSTTHARVNTPVQSLSVKQDGKIISFTEIHVPNLNVQLAAFKMMYWSHSTQTEAFVTVPEGGSNVAYPVFVICHGGWDAPLPLSHVSPYVSADTNTIDDPKQDLNIIVGQAVPGFITIIPMYRGYADSDGNVNGLDGNTIDVENSINAILGKYTTIQGHVYLSGVSMGGGVALKVASERSDIRSTVAISPFVGWDIIGEWAYKHQNNASAQDWIQRMTSHYGAFQPTHATYTNVSIEYSRITSPVLLLQGTNDNYVPWQTVQTLYTDMRNENKNVTLELFPGGDHGLGNVPKAQDVLSNWYAKYGE